MHGALTIICAKTNMSMIEKVFGLYADSASRESFRKSSASPGLLKSLLDPVPKERAPTMRRMDKT